MQHRYNLVKIMQQNFSQTIDLLAKAYNSSNYLRYRLRSAGNNKDLRCLDVLLIYFLLYHFRLSTTKVKLLLCNIKIFSLSSLLAKTKSNLLQFFESRHRIVRDLAGR